MEDKREELKEKDVDIAEKTFNNDDIKERILSKEGFIDSSSSLRDCILGNYVDIGEYSSLKETKVGDYTYFAGFNDVIYANIGKFTSIATFVRINPGNHPMDRVTMHHMTYRRVRYGMDSKNDDAFFQWRRSKPVNIGNDVWIGHGATIMAGVTIGDGSVIGAGAVVTKDVNPFEIVAGVPSKLIRKRFPDNVIEKLLKIKWWDWEDEKIRTSFNDFLDMDTFLKKHYKG